VYGGLVRFVVKTGKRDEFLELLRWDARVANDCEPGTLRLDVWEVEGNLTWCVSTEMPVLRRTVRIMRYVVNRGDKYGKLAVIGEVQKAGAGGRRYRAALCRCDCGKQVTPRISPVAARAASPKPGGGAAPSADRSP